MRETCQRHESASTAIVLITMVVEFIAKHLCGARMYMPKDPVVQEQSSKNKKATNMD